MDEFGGSHPIDDWVDIVVLRAVDGHTLPATGTIPVDQNAEGPPGAELLAELMDATVRLAPGEGCSQFIRDRLRAIPTPPLFAASAWLANARPVVVRDGHGVAAGLSVRYSTATGLRVVDPAAGGDIDQDQGG
ncbi:hypothetical protein G3I24_04660 [Micromonospora aurantiaca]|nr:hypothetical protein [Micromonospora aurantiaca]